ncbi:phosphopantetheine-binding protein [Streptomyces filipinensis]
MSFDEVKGALVLLGLEPAELQPDTSREDAGLDSLLTVELALLLRKRS